MKLLVPSMAAVGLAASLGLAVGVRSGCDAAAGNAPAQALTITAPVTHAPNLMKYYGGPVIAHGQVTQVIWNARVDANVSTVMSSFYPALFGSELFEWLDVDYSTGGAANAGSHAGQPGTNQHIGRPTWLGRRNLSESDGVITDAQIQAALGNAVRRGLLTASSDAVYMINTPASVTVVRADGRRTCDASQTVFLCAYHSTAAINGAHVKYAVVPDQSGDCLARCGSNSTAINNTTILASHELVATLLDPEVGFANGYDYPMGWAVAASSATVLDGESGNLCTGNATAVSGNLLAQLEYDNPTGTCVLTRPTHDFTLSTPVPRVILPVYTDPNVRFPGYAQVEIRSAVAAGSSAETLTLGARNLPRGVTHSFDPPTITAGGSSRLVLGEDTPTPTVANSTITIVGTGADGRVRTVDLPLSVVLERNNFAIDFSTPGVTLETGDPTYGHADVTFATRLTSGLATPVAFWFPDPLPPGVTARFDSPVRYVGETNILRLGTDSHATDGNATVRVSVGNADAVGTVAIAVAVHTGPVIYSVSPATGTVGDTVTVHGAGFNDVGGAMAVAFGPYPVTNPYCTTTDCMVKVPPGTGAQHVSVRNLASAKTTLASSRDLFTYAVPEIIAMTPSSGPMSGGTYVTVRGRGFIPDVLVGAGHTQFSFGGIASPYVLCLSSTSCTVRSPEAHQAGDVQVAARVFDAPPAVAPVKFSYHVKPLLKAIAYSTFFGIDGSVDLDGFAPPGGTIVALSSSNPQLVAVPPTMTVQAGFFSGNFKATLTPTDAARTVTLTATLDGASVSTNLALEPGPPLVVDLGVPALAQGSAATVRVSLNRPAPAGGVAIALVSSDSSALSVPATVVVPAGQQTASFSVTNAYGGAPKQVIVTATTGGLSASDSVWVPIDGSCLPRRCPSGQYWNSADCLCERGTPQ